LPPPSFTIINPQVKSAFAEDSVFHRLIFAIAPRGSRTAQSRSRENRARTRRSLPSGRFPPVRFQRNRGNAAIFAGSEGSEGGNSLQFVLRGGAWSPLRTSLHEISLLTGKFTGNLHDFNIQNGTPQQLTCSLHWRSSTKVTKSEQGTIREGTGSEQGISRSYQGILKNSVYGRRLA
jgi:hypothetical protein